MASSKAQSCAKISISGSSTLFKKSNDVASYETTQQASFFSATIAEASEKPALFDADNKKFGDLSEVLLEIDDLMNEIAQKLHKKDIVVADLPSDAGSSSLSILGYRRH